MQKEVDEERAEQTPGLNRIYRFPFPTTTHIQYSNRYRSAGTVLQNSSWDARRMMLQLVSLNKW